LYSSTFHFGIFWYFSPWKLESHSFYHVDITNRSVKTSGLGGIGETGI
jgi:hypothetical protein